MLCCPRRQLEPCVESKCKLGNALARPEPGDDTSCRLPLLFSIYPRLTRRIEPEPSKAKRGYKPGSSSRTLGHAQCPHRRTAAAIRRPPTCVMQCSSSNWGRCAEKQTACLLSTRRQRPLELEVDAGHLYFYSPDHGAMASACSGTGPPPNTSPGAPPHSRPMGFE